MAEDLALAWAAGFFDGEGSIGIYQRPSNGSRSYRLTVRASQKRPEVLEELKAQFGGTIKSGSNTPEWEVVSQQAAAFLSEIRPYLRVKGAEADVALAFQAGQQVGRTQVGAEELAIRLKELKHG